MNDEIQGLCVRSKASAYQRLKQIVEGTDNLVQKLQASNSDVQLRWLH